jgi:hypothetical protein
VYITHGVVVISLRKQIFECNVARTRIGAGVSRIAYRYLARAFEVAVRLVRFTV